MVHKSSLCLLLVLMVAVVSPLITAAATVEPYPSYTISINASGVIESDRYTFIDANGNPLKEDTANAVFQGPGVLGSSTVGYMKDIHISLTDLGNLIKMNYTKDEVAPFRWLPVIEDTPVGRAPGVTYAPLEGWAIAYNMTVYPTSVFPADKGYLIVTFSGYATDGIRPKVIGRDDDDIWVISSTTDIWVDNPRLLVSHYTITAKNLGSPYEPVFELNIVVIFNKATKMVQIFQKLTLKETTLPRECMSVSFNMALARVVIFDANPYCDRAFYGWKNVTIDDPEFFMVLSWTNRTLRKWVREDLRYSYYAAYMVAYPKPISFAIGSTWYDGPDEGAAVDASDIWHVEQLRYSGYNKYVFIDMSDIDRDGLGDGDQALIRVEWYNDTGLVMPENLPGHTLGWVMVMYGVYDVNGEGYDGGEGGNFRAGRLILSNGQTFDAPQIDWRHTGSLGWLNKLVSDTVIRARERQLRKTVIRLDTNQNGAIGAGETYISRDWYPTEELWWQLTFKFAPPKLCKLPSCCPSCGGAATAQTGAELVSCPPDFLVVPAPGATPDAAGAAYLNGRITALLTTFDVEAQNLVATVGYTNPGTKMLPYLMLRLTPIPPGVQDYPSRRSHYLTTDRRALPQLEWENRVATPWRDKHYWVVSIGGYHPNLVTYYFTDFTPISRIIGGPYSADFVVLPTGGVRPQAPYAGTTKGLGVIAVGKDHFGNIALLVYGLDAQDTYWTAYYAMYHWDTICRRFGGAQGILLEIDYRTTPTWGDGRGIPTAHHTIPTFNVLAASTEYEVIPVTTCV